MFQLPLRTYESVYVRLNSRSETSPLQLSGQVSPGALSALQLLWHVSLQVVQVLHLLLLVLHLRPQRPQLALHHRNLQTQHHFMTDFIGLHCESQRSCPRLISVQNNPKAIWQYIPVRYLLKVQSPAQDHT